MQPINPELFTNSASHHSPSSSPIQTEPVPISDTTPVAENKDDLEGSTSDTVTPNPRTRRKCSKDPEKESESRVRGSSAHPTNNRRANEPSQEITSNLCRRFPGLLRLFGGDDDRLGQKNNRHENDAEITDFRESVLCPAWIGNNTLRNGLSQDTRAIDIVKDSNEKVRDHISWRALLYQSRKHIAYSKHNGNVSLNGTGFVANAMSKIVSSATTDITLCDLIALPQYEYTNVKSNIIFSPINPSNITSNELIPFPQYGFHMDSKLSTIMSSNIKRHSFLNLSNCETMSKNYFVSDFGMKNLDIIIKSSYYDRWKSDNVFQDLFPSGIMEIIRSKSGMKAIKKVRPLQCIF